MSEIVKENIPKSSWRPMRPPAPKVTPKKKSENKVVNNGYEYELNEDVDLDEFKPSESRTMNKCITEAGVLSIINAKSGKRIIISNEIMEILNNPSKIVMSFTEDRIAIGENLPNNDNYFNVKRMKSKGVIYSAGIVKEITEIYELDFSNKTSITFFDVEYAKYEDNVVAIIAVD